MNTFKCIHCGKEKKLSRSSFNKYCSNACQRDYEYNQLVLKWLTEDVKGYSGKTKQLKPFIRRYLLQQNNNACVICGWNELHPIDNRPLVEIDHIDGDAENCKIDNLRVLCPNCHSKTSTFRSRNKTSKRKR